MKKHPIPHLLLCAALTLGAATLSAQGPGPAPGGSPAADAPPLDRRGPPPSPLFQALDTNGDGVISADEIANAPAALKTLAGPSGQITRESLRPAPPERDDRRPSGDSQRPGPRPEDRPHHRPPPDAQDDPADGPAGPDAPGPRPHHGPEDRAHRPPPPPPPAGPEGRHHGPPPGERLFEFLDTNHDGVISADEIAAAATALKQADTNGDGIIDRRDFRPPPPPPAPAASAPPAAPATQAPRPSAALVMPDAPATQAVP